MIECELRRLRCRDCGVRLEPVPSARPGARHTRDFEDVVAWLAQQIAFGAIVWCAPGRNSASLASFFEELGDRRESIRAVSIDMSGEYQRAIREARPGRAGITTDLPR